MKATIAAYFKRAFGIVVDVAFLCLVLGIGGATWLFISFGCGTLLCLTPLGYPLGLVIASLPAYPIAIIAMLACAFQREQIQVQIRRGRELNKDVKE